MKFWKLNWKFYIPLMVAICSATLPFWEPYFLTPEKDLTVRLISQSSLEPNVTTDKSLGLEITVDKVPVKTPILSVIEISNTGSKAIRSGEFESPLALSMSEDKAILRAQVSDTKPKNLQPKVRFDQNRLQIEPLLLNPHDTITLTVLSSGGESLFKPSARIVDVEDINIVTGAKKENNAFDIALLALAALVMGTLACAVMWRYQDTKTKFVTINTRTALLVSTTLFYTHLFTVVIIVGAIWGYSLWKYILALGIFLLPAIQLARWLENRPKMASEPSE